MTDHVDVERDGGVATVTMTRLDHYNSISLDMATDLSDITAGLVEDDDVRCLVLTGTENVFNTGADLTTLEGDPSDSHRLRRLATRVHETIQHLTNAPKPVVTGVNGVAAGVGFGLALSGDLVLVHEDARFEYAYPAIGLSGDGGVTHALPRLVGLRKALEITLQNEPISAEDSVDSGLATEVVPDDEFDDRLATVASDLAAGPTRAHAATKRLLRGSYSRDLGTQLTAEVSALADLAATDDYVYGYEAFFGDGEPTFRGE